MQEENQPQDLSPLLQNEEKSLEDDVHIDDDGNVTVVNLYYKFFSILISFIPL